MNSTEQPFQPPSFRTPVAAMLPAFPSFPGSGARAIPARVLPVLVCAAALAAALFTAAPATAAPITFATLGEGAGRVNDPVGVAVDNSAAPTRGDVYVADENNRRIDEFSPAQKFIRAFGWGVADGETQALQTCTTTCFMGLQGAGAGETRPAAVAVDSSAGPSAGDLYVSDYAQYRVEKFDPAGHFILMFGSEVNKSAVQTPGRETEENVCPAAGHPGDACQAGAKSTAPGGFSAAVVPGTLESAFPVAVDSFGDVWVGDEGRLERFSPAGAFLSAVKLPFSGPTVALAVDSSGDPYVLKPFVPALNEVQILQQPPSGEFTLSFEGQTTPALPAEHGIGDRIVKALEELSTIGAGNVESVGEHEGLYSFFFRGALAGKNLPQITATGGAEVTTSRDGVPTVPGVLSKLKPNGELIETLDSSGNPNAIGFDPATDSIFVSDQLEPAAASGANLGKATLLQFDSAGAQTEAFGAGQVIGAPHGNALAFGAGAKSLYAASTSVGENSAVQAFLAPPLGPLFTAGTLAVKPLRSTTATLRAGLNPEGAETHYHFQYLTQRQFEEDNEQFGAGTKETPQETLPADFAEHQLATPIAGLSGETAYRFRLLAENANGDGNLAPSEPNQAEESTFTTLPPAQIDEEFATEVTATSATLGAQINPLGNLTEYRFEYLTESAYQENLAAELDPFTGAALTPIPDAAIGKSEEDQGVSRHLQGLAPSTTYRYRVFAHNVGGPARGATQAFTTQNNAAFALPDNRAWELVSPPDKHGAKLKGISVSEVVQASASGNAITYVASAPTEAEPQGNAVGVQVLSRRSLGGWESQDIVTPHEAATGAPVGHGQEYQFFSNDLSLGLVHPFGAFMPSLSSEASDQTPYLRTNYPSGDPADPCLTSCYRPLVTSTPGFANVPPGTAFGGEAKCVRIICGPEFFGATSDLSHVVLGSEVALTEGAPAQGLYEWAAGQLTFLGTGRLGYEGGSARHAISDDGSRIVLAGAFEGLKGLLLRDTATGAALKLDAVQGGSGKGVAEPRFQVASSDDSKVFFTDSQRLTANAGAETGRPDLYRCEIVEEEEGELHCKLSDLTPLGSAEEGVDVLGVLGAGADGSSLYFVANGKLAPGAVDGNCNQTRGGLAGATCNLYVRRDGEEPSLIAVLSSQDFPDWKAELKGQTARLSPDGHWLAFMSQRSLTGYDNRDARSAQPAEEVYLYDTGAKRLLCASCSPGGARPLGVEYRSLDVGEGGLAGGNSVWNPATSIAANIPGWTPYTQFEGSLYQSRYLSNSGRLFFNSSDALVPQDSNRTEDVYQYEPPGVGSCTSSSPTFGAASGGCINLISSGTSGEESAFLDASESGDDVFFLTQAKLSPQDPDTALDVYDARVGGGESPPAQPVICQGDACQQPATPPNDPTPGSLTFSGAGNLTECPKGKVEKSGKCVARKHKKAKHRKKGKKAKRSASHNRGGQK